MDAGQRDQVDLNDILTGLKDKMRKILGVRRSLTLKLEPGVPRIKADPRRLRENLLRLISDVRQATPDGGVVEISTRAIETADGNLRAKLAIRDTRKVLREARERIFDPYYQSGPGKGNAGFSLALVYQFIALSGGCIEVESTPGEGSAYLLSFPAASGFSGSGPALTTGHAKTFDETNSDTVDDKRLVAL